MGRVAREVAVVSGSGPEPTILYVVANESLGWRKVGIGFGNRLEKWRRDGWVLEQQALFVAREDALLAESMLKRQIATFYFDRSELPADGYTEMWPYRWGTVDVAAVHRCVSEFIQQIKRVWSLEFYLRSMESAADAFLAEVEAGNVSRDDIDSSRAAVQEVVDAVRTSVMREFVQTEAPDWTREEIERLQLNWSELMRKRQVYWQLRASASPDSVTEQ